METLSIIFNSDYRPKRRPAPRATGLKRWIAVFGFSLTTCTLFVFRYNQRSATINKDADELQESGQGPQIPITRRDHLPISFETKTNPSLPDCPASVSGNFNHGIPKDNLNFHCNRTGEYVHLFYSDVKLGGIWQPNDCRPIHDPAAVIVPVRNRHRQLELYLSRIHPFLQQQKVPYVIITVNQTGIDKFNRGALFNAGFLSVPPGIDCFVFADVDMIPDRYDNMFVCSKTHPRHMSPLLSNRNYKALYDGYFGGITSFTRSQFVKINGFSNRYWGWGGEDDDLYARVVKYFGRADHVPISIGQITHLNHLTNESASVNPARYRLLRRKYNYQSDGLSTDPPTCTILHFSLRRLTTDLVVRCSRKG